MDSRYIEHRLNELRDRKSKNAFLESVMNDPKAIVLNDSNGYKTKLFPGNKGPKTITWEQTKQMAYDLNNNGFDVVFLPELKSDVCADSLISDGRIYKIADFKYCITSKANTLSIDLGRGFEQANNVVLKLTNMDSGTFRDAIDYLLRNGIPYGNIILINKYGKTLELLKKEFRTGIYKKRIKGFL